MDFLQLKYSVERLTECLKVIPKEDKKYIQDLIKKYKYEMQSIKFLDEKNEHFDHDELKSIERFIKPFRSKVLSPLNDKNSSLHKEISDRCGFTKAEEALDKINHRLYKIAEWRRYKKGIPRCWSYASEVFDKSRIYQNALSEAERKEAVFYREAENCESIKQVESEIKNLESILDLFDIDLALKNLIAYRSRNMGKIPQGVDVTIRESIQIEIEKQWLIFLETAQVKE
jgi:uncharacterized protein YnzC (UPF0291/DUF896 family)